MASLVVSSLPTSTPKSKIFMDRIEKFRKKYSDRGLDRDIPVYLLPRILHQIHIDKKYCLTDDRLEDMLFYKPGCSFKN